MESVRMGVKMLILYNRCRCTLSWNLGIIPKSANFKEDISSQHRWLSFTEFYVTLTEIVFILSILIPLIGEGNGSSLQYSCLENPVDRGAWWAAVHRVAQSQTRLKWLSMHACIGKRNGKPLQFLAWIIPGTKKPGGLPSMGSHSDGHDWSDLTAAAAIKNYKLDWYGSLKLALQRGGGGAGGGLVAKSCPAPATP